MQHCMDPDPLPPPARYACLVCGGRGSHWKRDCPHAGTGIVDMDTSEHKSEP